MLRLPAPAVSLLPSVAALALAIAGFARAQIQASWPLANDLSDTTGNHTDVTLHGATTGPADGVCVGGTYGPPGSGDELYTPTVLGFDETDFQIDVDFNITAFSPQPGPPRTSVLVGSRGWRWIGIEVDNTTGEVGVLFNNGGWLPSTTVVNLGQWYWASLKYDNGNVELMIDGVSVLTGSIPVLNTNSDHRFTTTNYGFGAVLNGCVRNLVIANDATIGTPAARGANYGTGCGNLSLTTNSLPTVGNLTFAYEIEKPAPIAPLAFLAFGDATVEPGLDLTGAGLPGCFAYTNLSSGIFGAYSLDPTTGIGAVPLPIPPLPALAGTFLTAQAVAFDPSQLVTSNGTRIQIGM